MDRNKLGIIILIISAISFGTLGIWGKLAYSVNLTPIQLLSLRFTFSSIILWIVSFLFFRDKLKVSKKQIKFLFLQGGILYSLTSYAYFRGLMTIKVSLATIIFFLHPIYTYFMLAFVMKRKITRNKWIALIISIIGIILVVDINNLSLSCSSEGMFYVLVAGLLYSLFTVSNEVSGGNIDGFISTLYITTFSALTINMLAGFKIDYWFSLTNEQLGVVFGISVVGTIIGILGFIIGIKLVGATSASVLSVFEPISGVLLAFIFLNETVTYIQILGIIIVLIAVYLVSLEQKNCTSL